MGSRISAYNILQDLGANAQHSLFRIFAHNRPHPTRRCNGVEASCSLTYTTPQTNTKGVGWNIRTSYHALPTQAYDPALMLQYVPPLYPPPSAYYPVLFPAICPRLPLPRPPSPFLLQHGSFCLKVLVIFFRVLSSPPGSFVRSPSANALWGGFSTSAGSAMAS